MSNARLSYKFVCAVGYIYIIYLLFLIEQERLKNVKGCGSNVEENIFQILKVATNDAFQYWRVCQHSSCLLNCWSLLLQFSSAILVHIVQCKVVVSFVATFQIWTFYLKIRITTFKENIWYLHPILKKTTLPVYSFNGDIKMANLSSLINIYKEFILNDEHYLIYMNHV